MKTIFCVFALLVSPCIFAVCPVCTFAVGAGIGLTQYLGVDDLITGLWLGGLIVSLIIFTNTWLAQKIQVSHGVKALVAFFYYASSILPLYFTKIIGHPLNTLWGIDRLILGVILGSAVFFLGAICYEILKRHNNNRAYFPFQKVAMPVVPLLILSVMFCIFL